MRSVIPKADYDFELVGDIVIIYDLDLGNKSVTNDIENIVLDLRDQIPDLRHKKIIYQDSEKIFDGIELTKEGDFSGFYSINEKELHRAVAKVKSENIK